MDNPEYSKQPHLHFAGRLPAGETQPVTLRKNGVRHVRRLEDGSEKSILSIGLACSECFSGANLHRILKPGFEYEMQVMKDLLERGGDAAPLSIHTSSGVPEALENFLIALEPHVPWKNRKDLDWVCSLQLEGASAVWAGIDMLLQVSMIETGRKDRIKVAVGNTSYHGPPSTSFGGKSPLWHKYHQLKYPTPLAGEDINEELLLEQYKQFLNDYGDEIGVMLIEPQWGSSQAALPWPKTLLKEYIKLAKARGIKILCDEIMCGLGRHGHGTLFVSEAWELDPDAVTFGKSIAGGCFPLSGAILKQGRDLLAANGQSVMQSHTYAGSSTRALMAAIEVLNEMPNWMSSIAKLGKEMEYIFRFVNKKSDGMVQAHGQGLMWGGVFSRDGQCKDEKFRNNLIKVFQETCEEVGVLPYFVPVGGFMVSPVIDIDVGTLYEIGQKLESAIMLTKEKVGWESDGSISSSDDNTSVCLDVNELAAEIAAAEVKCLPQLHATRSCTSCSNFVNKAIRTRFLNV